jgi:hypothetical protein
MKPRISILSPEFHYTSALCTDLHETFRRVRREQARERAAAAKASADAAAKIKTFALAKRA